MRKISRLTNSEIGSVHWFNTIMGNILRTGEYLMEHGTKGLMNETVKGWGGLLYDQAKELIDNAEAWRESTYISKENIIEQLKQTIEKLEKM